MENKLKYKQRKKIKKNSYENKLDGVKIIKKYIIKKIKKISNEL